jgi:hypothetical protein
MAHPLLPPAPARSAPRPAALRLVATFKAAGWRYPFQDGDGVEVWQGQAHLGTLPAVLLFQVIRHYLHGALIEQDVHRSLSPMPLAKVEPTRLQATQGRKLRGRTTD